MDHDLYLGRLLDDRAQITPQPILYPLDHLTTHALLLGATGSGKTGLGMVMIEEALLRKTPVLLLDVKGDLANLLLTFPDLVPSDFAPWIDIDAAQRRGQTPGEAARATAQHWREGLAEWDIDPARIAQLRQSADLALYTPGSSAGQSVDILGRFGTPPGGTVLEEEAAARAQGFTSALLGLAGITADPLRSREHILLTTLIRHAWQTGAPLDVATLIQMVQKPPVERVGVFDLESFFPQRDRFELALTLNNLLAAPGFALWREGTPLDIGHFITAPDGRPRATVFYLAHLPEGQKQFFITLFLEELRTWVRHQPGTRTLRALLYFDEIYGYLPPHPSNPPTKVPLMALVKQGRAAGLGVILATQNPADLDYKGLSNIGTWCVGALRTERDQDRVLEGMKGTLTQSGTPTSQVEDALGQLKPRHFLLHDARAGQLAFFHSRWAMSYLRGPLTIAEVQQLTPTPSHPDAVPTPSPQPNMAFSTPKPTPVREPEPTASLDQLSHPPTLDPAITQAFLPPTVTVAWAIQRQGTPDMNAAQAHLVYRPHLLGVGVAHIFHESANVNLSDEQVWLVKPGDESWNIRWDQGKMIALRIEDLMTDPPEAGVFEPFPSEMGRKSSYKKWGSALKTHIYHNSQITLWSCRRLRLYSRPNETKRDYLERCRYEAEQRKAQELDEERQKFTRKLSRIQEKIRREELELEQDEAELAERRREELLSGAESLLGLFSKRKRSRALSRTSRQRRYVKKAAGDVEESEEMLQVYEEQIEDLEATWQAAAQQIVEEWDATLQNIRELTVRAKRADIDVRFCGLAWFPFWDIVSPDDGTRHALPAYIAPQT